jgi:hypothetical protein
MVRFMSNFSLTSSMRNDGQLMAADADANAPLPNIIHLFSRTTSKSVVLNQATAFKNCQLITKL